MKNSKLLWWFIGTMCGIGLLTTVLFVLGIVFDAVLTF